MPLKKKTSRVAIPVKNEKSGNQVLKKLKRFEEMNFFAKEPAGSTVYPAKKESLISSGLRDLSPAVQREKKPFFMQELFRETFHQTV